MTRRARPRGVGLIAAVIALTTMTAGVALPNDDASDPWTETRTGTYDTGDMGPMVGMWGCRPMGRDGAVGTVCLGTTVGDTFTVSIDDDSGREVGGIVRVRDNRGWTVLYEPFCGTSGRLPSVPGDLTVHLDAPGDVRATHWFGGPGCNEVRVAGHSIGTLGATRGRVQVTFTGGD